MAILSPRAIVASRYKILTFVGQGGMGKVYRAEHLGLKKVVALKVIGAEIMGDLEARFEREARATARLDHPGCARILDYGRTPDRGQYIAMELVDGPTLAQLVARESRLSTARAVRIVRDVLAALAHAHAKGVLHRDIKPENIMLAQNPAPRAVVIDFGLARLVDDARLTAAGSCFGTPSYLAPERLLGRPYDARADVFAVGVILYELLAGRRPFDGATPRQILCHQLARPPHALRALRSDVSPQLDAVILRALAPDPTRRFADAEEMLSALDYAPIAEHFAATRAAELHREDEPTAAIEELVLTRPSWLHRAWSWLRYGSWRWRECERTQLRAIARRSTVLRCVRYGR